jgi:hypothetical protein
VNAIDRAIEHELHGVPHMNGITIVATLVRACGMHMLFVLAGDVPHL